jgi:hypothetical protein
MKFMIYSIEFLLVLVLADAALVLNESSTSSRSDVSDFTSRFRQAVLAAHNVYRARHGQAGVKLDPSLTALAQAEAERSLRLKHFDYNPALEDFGRSNAQGWSTFQKEYTGI